MRVSKFWTLRSLAAIPMLGSTLASAHPAGGGPINVIGFGACGGRIVRRLASKRRGAADGDFIAADDPRPNPGLPTFESLGVTSEPNNGRPLILVTGVSSRSRGEYAWRRATEWSEARRAAIAPVVVLGFQFEGSYRAHGIALARRFAARFGTVSLIDNQAIDEQFLSHIDEISLLGLWDRINDHAVPRIERVIAASRRA